LTVGRRRAWAGHLPEEEGGPDRWGQPVGGRERGQDTLLGSGVVLGRGGFYGWAKSDPATLFPFSYLFSIFFSVFYFILYLLQKWFKTIETNSYILQIFCTLF
jgi:hypothetical protein